MAYILIDGYNLIGIAHDNLEKARNDIIERLKKYSEIKGHEVTIVFDGWKRGQRDETRIKFRDLTVIYSRLGEKADLTIKKIISSSTRPWIVVSSDREVADYAERKDHSAVASGEFEEKLYSAIGSLMSDPLTDSPDFGEGFQKDDDEDIYCRPDRARGNPRKLSKKQKKKIRALSKL